MSMLDDSANPNSYAAQMAKMKEAARFAAQQEMKEQADFLERGKTTPTLITLQRGVTVVHVIGAGGIGARIVPGVVKLLREGDEIHVWDHDIVEERNLHRQHFTQDDIGIPKAEVMQSRYHTDRLPVVAHIEKITASDPVLVLRNRGTGARVHVVMGCVDTREARRNILSWVGHFSPHIYIDGGNDRRNGQVLMGWSAVPSKAVGNVLIKSTLRATRLSILDLMPQVFQGKEEDDLEGCGLRVDMQTVNVNNMCAALMLNALAIYLSELPFSTCGWMFSVFNSIEPIRIVGVSTTPYDGLGSVHPDLHFATTDGEGAK